MVAQVDELTETMTIGGRTLRIIDIARARAERAEATAQETIVHATNWQARAIRAEAAERQAVASTSFWRAESADLARQLRGYRRREWLMVALCTLIGVLALALWIVAMGWV